MQDDPKEPRVADMSQVQTFVAKAQYPISVERYHQMIEDGELGEDDRVELVEGVLVEMSPQSPGHARVLSALAGEFRSLGREWAVRVQLPLTLARSEPEPDLVVCPRPLERATKWHPTTASLVVEVARSSVKADRAKATFYAEAGVLEYWIVDVETRSIEVFREPDGVEFRDVTRVREGVMIPVAVPGIAVDVGWIFDERT